VNEGLGNYYVIVHNCSEPSAVRCAGSGGTHRVWRKMLPMACQF
jgi:hypothetical protein